MKIRSSMSSHNARPSHLQIPSRVRRASTSPLGVVVLARMCGARRRGGAPETFVVTFRVCVMCIC